MTTQLRLPQRRLSGTKRILFLVAGVVLGLALVGFAASLLLRVSAERAREIALSATGGGQVMAQSIDREGFWNEYSFQISNNGAWYEVEVDSFGTVTELESSWDSDVAGGWRGMNWGHGFHSLYWD